jgi:predicted acylesterase/phospholipase RssA
MKKTLFIITTLILTLSFATTALILSGGGARGFAHVGLLRVMELYKLKPDVIIGTSAGSLIGAFYACGYSPDEMMDAVKEFNKQKIMARAFPNLPLSVVSWKPIDKFLYKYLGNKNIEDLKIKLVIVATNMETGNIEIFTKGNLLKAVEASCSIPGFFPPVKIGDNYYVDGGILLDDPTSIAKSFGVNKTILSITSTIPLSVTKDSPYFQKVLYDFLYKLREDFSKSLNINDMSNMLDLILKSVNYFNFDQFIYNNSIKNVDLILNPLKSIRQFSSIFDFNNANKYYQMGFLCALSNIKELKKYFK